MLVSFVVSQFLPNVFFYKYSKFRTICGEGFSISQLFLLIHAIEIKISGCEAHKFLQTNFFSHSDGLILRMVIAVHSFSVSVKANNTGFNHVHQNECFRANIRKVFFLSTKRKQSAIIPKFELNQALKARLNSGKVNENSTRAHFNNAYNNTRVYEIGEICSEGGFKALAHATVRVCVRVYFQQLRVVRDTNVKTIIYSGV